MRLTSRTRRSVLKEKFKLKQHRKKLKESKQAKYMYTARGLSNVA